MKRAIPSFTAFRSHQCLCASRNEGKCSPLHPFLFPPLVRVTCVNGVIKNVESNRQSYFAPSSFIQMKRSSILSEEGPFWTCIKDDSYCENVKDESSSTSVCISSSNRIYFTSFHGEDNLFSVSPFFFLLLCRLLLILHPNFVVKCCKLYMLVRVKIYIFLFLWYNRKKFIFLWLNKYFIVSIYTLQIKRINIYIYKSMA